MNESQSMRADFGASAKEPWRSLGLRAVLILLLTVTAYLPALRAGFVWDDHNNITDNQLLRTLDGLKRIWIEPTASFQYYPLTYTGFWVEYHLWALDPLGYHVVNVLLHALNAFLVWVLLERLEVPGVWMAALIFAVHPVHVESVAWITELKNLLSEFFCLSAFLTWLPFWRSGRYRWGFYSVSVAFFVCALLSKTSAVALPWAMLLVMWWKQERVGRRDVLALVPFVVVGVALALLTVWIERKYVGAHGPEWQFTFVERCLVAARVVCFSAGKLIWPHPLVFIYPRWEVSQQIWWQYLFVLAVVAAVVALWALRKRVGKGALVGVLFFIATAASVPAFINLYFMRFTYVADHFQYLGSLGLIALAGATTCRLLVSRKSQWAVAVPVVVVLGALSWQHCKVFRNEETLWRSALAKNPKAWLAQTNLGVVLLEQGKFEEAIVEFQAALRIKPDFEETHNDLGQALACLGRTMEAIAEYQEALRIEPNLANAHVNLGLALASLGKAEEAMAEYRRALQINLGSVEAHNNLGNVMLQKLRFTEAEAEYREALRIDHDNTQTRNNLAVALARQGRVQEAIAEYEEVVRIEPKYADVHYGLGVLLATQGAAKEAAVHYREAIRLRPDWPQALAMLAYLLATAEDAGARNAAEAVQLAERLCKITDYRQDDALGVLAAAYAEAGRFADAVRVAEQAIELARASGKLQLVTRLEEQSKLYQDGHPYRQHMVPLLSR